MFFWSNMPKENIETKVKKAIINIDKTLTNVNIVLNDLGMKLCHIIKEKRNYYDMLRGNDYLKWNQRIIVLNITHRLVMKSKKCLKN